MPDHLKRPFILGRRRWRADAVFWAVVAFLTLVSATSTALFGLLAFPPTGTRNTLVEPSIPLSRWRIAWSPLVEGPAVEQSVQLAVVSLVVVTAAALVSILAVATGLLLWRQRVDLRYDQYAVRRAVGARRAQILAEVIGEGWIWVAGTLSGLTIVLLLLPWTIIRTFPGETNLGKAYLLALAPVLILIISIGRLELNAGEIRVRNGMNRFGEVLTPLTTILITGFVALTGVLLLTRHSPAESFSTEASAMTVQTVDLSGYDPDVRGATIEEWQRQAKSEGALLGAASAGTARGVGTRDQLSVDCGACLIGTFLVPLQVVRAEFHSVAPDTFSNLGRSVVQGRDFFWQLDGGDSPGVAIVNQTLARERFESRGAVGRRIQFGDSDWLTVVGVVSDRDHSRHLTEYEVFLPVGQADPANVELIIESSSGMVGVSAETVPPGITVGRARSMHELFDVYHWFRTVLRLLGLVTGILVCVGCWVAARREAESLVFEYGVRMAVGARNADLARFLAKRVCRRLVFGFGAGAWLSLFLGMGLHRAPGAVPQLDLSIWAGIALFMAGTVLLASAPSYVAAARMSPAEALRVRA